MYFSKPKKLNNLDDCQKASRFYGRMSVAFFTELVICVALAVVFYTRTTDFWSPIIFTALAVITSIGLTVNLFALYPLGVWRRHILKNKNTMKELAVVVEYEASLLGLEPVSKIEFKFKEPPAAKLKSGVDASPRAS